MKGGDDSRRSSGRSDIFCSWAAPLSFRQVTHFEITYATAEVPPITQNPLDLISFNDMPRPWCWTFSCEYLIIRSVTWPFLGMITGNLISSVKLPRLIRPPTRNTPSLSRKGSRQCNELVFLMAVFFCLAADLSSPSTLAWSDLRVLMSSWNAIAWTA